MRKKINHNIRYSEKDYVQKNYMRDGKAVIPIKINKLEKQVVLIIRKE